MPFSLLAPAAALKMICVNLRLEKQLCKATEAHHVFVPAAWLLRLDTVETELEILASSTLNRYRYARTASRRLLAAMAALLPPATQARWRDELWGELHTLFGVPRLAVTLRRPALRSRQARP